MSQISDAEQELNMLWHNLQNDWVEARIRWQDNVAENFERIWWNELEQEIPQMIESISQLDNALRQAHVFLEKS